jgi:hypothetical protein
MRPGDKPYVPPPWSDEDSRTLLNWLSTRVTDDGKRCHPDYRYDRRLIEQQLRLACVHKLAVVAGRYLPPPVPLKGATTRGKPRKPRTPMAA